MRVPVAAGAAGPLVRERLVARMLDLESALDPERPDLSAVELDPRHSAEVIVDTALAHPGLTIVTTGPLTNLALALRYVPAIAPKSPGSCRWPAPGASATRPPRPNGMSCAIPKPRRR